MDMRGPVRSHATGHTVMLTNVNSSLTQGALVSLLEDLSPCMRGTFDFFFCPWDTSQNRNLGYAIINFYSLADAAEFEHQWSNNQWLAGRQVCVVPATLQGRAANVRHFYGVDHAHHEDARFQPLIRASPNDYLQPMSVVSEPAPQQEVSIGANFQQPGVSYQHAAQRPATTNTVLFHNIMDALRGAIGTPPVHPPGQAILPRVAPGVPLGPTAADFGLYSPGLMLQNTSDAIRPGLLLQTTSETLGPGRPEVRPSVSVASAAPVVLQLQSHLPSAVGRARVGVCAEANASERRD